MSMAPAVHVVHDKFSHRRRSAGQVGDRVSFQFSSAVAHRGHYSNVSSIFFIEAQGQFVTLALPLHTGAIIVYLHYFQSSDGVTFSVSLSCYTLGPLLKYLQYLHSGYRVSLSLSFCSCTDWLLVQDLHFIQVRNKVTFSVWLCRWPLAFI